MYGVTKKEISISGFILHILLSEGAERAGQGRVSLQSLGGVMIIQKKKNRIRQTEAFENVPTLIYNVQY